ncbi:hypothetical protein O181_128550 [Austropuccinia psidii MF-1]|uniref:Uncharacterized protein n=1 Tax=Austropuccinia psidii MF-1 TaxID=1389203 RepID=A0A9Q3L0D6_9BASI|nr:hypothetical protein [Austropuccinia psidii MF-1]
MVRQENSGTASTVTSIIPASTVISDHNSTVIIAQNNQQEPISSELISLDISNTLQKAKNLANNQEQAISPQAAPKKVIDLIMAEANKIQKDKAPKQPQEASVDIYKSQPEGLQQCTAAQRVLDPCRSVEKLHELIPYCKKIPGSSQHLQVTEWMASIDGKEEYDSFNTRMEEKQPSTTKTSAKTCPSGQKHQFQREKAATSSKQGQREGTSPKALQPEIQDSKYSAGCHGKCNSDGQN